MGVKLEPLWASPFAGSPCFSLNPSAQHLFSTHFCKSCGKNWIASPQRRPRGGRTGVSSPYLAPYLAVGSYSNIGCIHWVLLSVMHSLLWLP